MNQHTVKAYGDELNQLTAEVVRMGGLAEAQVADAIESVARRDVALARAVVDRDNRLDALHRDIEKKSIRLIALRQPVASDLRRTLGAMKVKYVSAINGNEAWKELEKIAAYAQAVHHHKCSAIGFAGDDGNSRNCSFAEGIKKFGTVANYSHMLLIYTR